MAQALADRRGLAEPDPEARLAAVVGFAVLRLAMTRWLELPKVGPLAPLVEEEFDRVQRITSARTVPVTRSAGRRTMTPAARRRS